MSGRPPAARIVGVHHAGRTEHATASSSTTPTITMPVTIARDLVRRLAQTVCIIEHGDPRAAVDEILVTIAAITRQIEGTE